MLYNSYMNQLELFANENVVLFSFIFLILIVWVTVLKGLALWKSAQRKDKWWFIALLVINTVGFLEILYLFVFSKKKTTSVDQDTTNKETA